MRQLPIFPFLESAHKWLWLAASAAFLAACAPAAKPPSSTAMPVPTSWQVPGAAAAVQGPAADAVAWQTYFADPQLLDLIEQALHNSRDLQVAALRVEEARAAYGIQRAQTWPAINAGGQAARSRVPGDLNLSGQPVVGGQYEASVGVSNWELDLWGRVRSLNQAALQEYLASDAAARGVRLALIAAVAQAYLDLRELDERMALAYASISTREETYRIFRRRNEVGSVSTLDLTQVESLLNQARSLAAQLQQARALQANALNLLVGAASAPAAQTDVRWREDSVFRPLRLGLPADLLSARPDIIAAEHRLTAAQANIEAARAAFFPRIALTTSVGTASAQLAGLFDGGSGAWTFAPSISLPIFDGGQRSANFDLAQVRSEIAVAQYEHTIQTAFREVADALASQVWLNEQVGLQRKSLATLTEWARLAQLRYDNGAATYLEVLDAQRELLNAEQQLVQLRKAVLSSHIALYKALGGGSSVEAELLPQAQAVPVTHSSIPSSAQREGV